MIICFINYLEKYLIFLLFLILSCSFEAVRVYFLMPFPGSQTSEMVWFSYPLHLYRWLFRLPCLLGLFYFGFKSFYTTNWIRFLVLLGFLIASFCFYFFNVQASAEYIFKRLDTKHYGSKEYYDQGRIVFGIVHEGKSRAYPIEMLGYHHFIEDKIGDYAYLLTYCTVCHSGRIFSPVVDGKHLTFRLVGMDLFNALLEDTLTGSWWRQATGECVAGSMKGKTLKELPFVQCSVSEWVSMYPDAKFLLEEEDFLVNYRKLDGFARGLKVGGLIGVYNGLDWQDKSWIIGIKYNNKVRAYLWKDVIKHGPLVDTVGNKFVEVYADSVSHTFYARDYVSDSLIPSYQEFWYSWRTFYPNTERKIDY